MAYDLPFHEFFEALSEEDLKQIVHDYEVFIANKGTIGKSYIRTLAEQYDGNGNVLTIIDLANWAHRYFALKYLNLGE
jgi:hypothetical protein